MTVMAVRDLVTIFINLVLKSIRISAASMAIHERSEDCVVAAEEAMWAAVSVSAKVRLISGGRELVGGIGFLLGVVGVDKRKKGSNEWGKIRDLSLIGVRSGALRAWA